MCGDDPNRIDSHLLLFDNLDHVGLSIKLILSVSHKQIVLLECFRFAAAAKGRKPTVPKTKATHRVNLHSFVDGAKNSVGFRRGKKEHLTAKMVKNLSFSQPSK
jgi:hypothetical protein